MEVLVTKKKKNLKVPLWAMVPRQSISSSFVIPIPVSLQFRIQSLIRRWWHSRTSHRTPSSVVSFSATAASHFTAKRLHLFSGFQLHETPVLRKARPVKCGCLKQKITWPIYTQNILTKCDMQVSNPGQNIVMKTLIATRPHITFNKWLPLNLYIFCGT